MPDMVPFGMKSPRKENRQPKLTVIPAVIGAAYSRVAGTILPVATVSPPIYSEVDRATNQLCSYSAVSQP